MAISKHIRKLRVTAAISAAIGILAVPVLLSAQSAEQTSDNPDAVTISPPQNAPVPAASPTVEERYQAFLSKSRPVEATVSFTQRMRDGQVRKILADAGVAPYAVLMHSDGMTGVHAVQAAKADLSILAAARQSTARMQDKSEKKNRARSRDLRRSIQQQREQIRDARQAGQADQVQASRDVLKELRQSRALARSVRGDTAIIYAVKVVGTPDQIKSLAAVANVAQVEPGFFLGERLVTPEPKVPADAKSVFTAADVDALSPAQVEQQLQGEGGTQ